MFEKIKNGKPGELATVYTKRGWTPVVIAKKIGNQYICLAGWRLEEQTFSEDQLYKTNGKISDRDRSRISRLLKRYGTSFEDLPAEKRELTAREKLLKQLNL